MSHAEPFPPDWPSLTSLPKKGTLYAEDSFFREGLADLADAWGDRLGHCLQHTALLLFKPDAVGGRRIGRATQLLADRGFRPIAVECLAFNAPIYHGLYRYQLRRGTLDKVRLYTRWAEGLPCLAVAYLDEAPEMGLPASVRFKTIKGHALVDRRQRHDLRTLLGSVNSIANFIHAADEPADVVREVPICIPATRRTDFLAAIRRSDIDAGAHAFRQSLAEAERLIPPHDVDPFAAAERIRRLVAADATTDESRRTALAMIEAALTGRILDLRTFEHALGPLVISVNPLDMFIFASQFIARDLPGERGELDDDCISGWLQPRQR